MSVVFCCQGDIEEDEAIPDKEEDIRPRFHRSRTVAQQHEGDGIKEDDDEDDEFDDDDTVSDWNLRESSACVKGDLLPTFMFLPLKILHFLSFAV